MMVIAKKNLQKIITHRGSNNAEAHTALYFVKRQVKYLRCGWKARAWTAWSRILHLKLMRKQKLIIDIEDLPFCFDLDTLKDVFLLLILILQTKLING